MKKNHLIVAAGILLVICIAQQWHIQAAAVPANEGMPIPAATWDVALLSRSVEPPPGARSASGNEDMMRLTGTTIRDGGFDACLWLDTSEVPFTGRAATLREERIAAIAAHYAGQIAASIPGAVVAAGIEAESRAESGALHSVYLVEHPHGHIAVSAGYVTARDGSLSDGVKVNVLSRNPGRGPATGVGSAGARFAEPHDTDTAPAPD